MAQLFPLFTLWFGEEVGSAILAELMPEILQYNIREGVHVNLLVIVTRDVNISTNKLWPEAK